MNRKIPCILGGIVALIWTGTSAAAEAPYQPRPKGTLTFTRDIAPIVFAHCAGCHRPGEVAPFSLLSYRDVQKRATQIQRITERRIMPPWKPVAGHGEFRNVRRLSNDEIGIIKQWAEEGATEGDAKALPPAPKFVSGWQLGKPDLIVTMHKPFTVPAEGRDIYQNFVLSLTIPAGKYIRAVEYRPSNPRVVHHAGMAFDTTGKVRAQAGSDPAAGFAQTSLSGQLLPGNTSFWVPGKDSQPLPDGFALAWPKGADLILQLHLHPSGKAEVEQSSIGFYFTSTPPRRQMSQLIVGENNIDIAPGDKAYRLRKEMTVSADVEVHGLFPHMHLIGKEIKVTAVRPDGSKQVLLWIEDWDFNWQNFYEYVKPVPLPKGTKLVLETIHDNSAENPHNPSSPPRRVRYGEQSFDEMALIFLHVTATTPPSANAPVARAPGNTDPDFLKEARELIRKYDKDGDGKLSAEEIAQIPSVAGQDIKQLIQRFDRDKDGKLDADEIAAALKAMRSKSR
jgi:mono/diheme cytochrome c family protein